MRVSFFYGWIIVAVTFVTMGIGRDDGHRRKRALRVFVAVPAHSR